MASGIATFDEIMAPLGGETFLNEYLGKKPVHIEGDPDRFGSLMNWEILNRLLGTASIWSSQSLMLVLDKEQIPAGEYCSRGPGRDGGMVMRPDLAKVKALLKRGATLVANEIDDLTPELSRFSKILEETLGAKVQGNLYLSSKKKQGFGAHFDTHDVIAVHCAGEKVWPVFHGRADHPIAHAMFKNYTRDHHEKAKGELWRNVRLRPGDILYLPRGQYHYALAEDGACMHIAFGVTYPIGLDVMSYLFERMLAESITRHNLPRDEAGLAAYLGDLGRQLAQVTASRQTTDDIKAFMQGFSYPRESFDLPGLIDDAEVRFVVKADGLKLVEQGGRFGLVKSGTREAVEIPAPVKDLVAWTLERGEFGKTDLARAFSGEPAAKIEKFIADMERMRVIAPVA